MQFGVAQAGPVQIELIQQPLRPAEPAHYAQLAYEFVGEITTPGRRVAYFDTVAAFGFHTQVVEDFPGLLDGLAQIARTSAEWDGRDPVRLLTRDGYRRA